MKPSVIFLCGKLKRPNDLLTVASIDLLDFVATMLIHEERGNVGVCVVLGSHWILYLMSMPSGIQSQ
jgi:hypothetical protein